MTSGWNASRKVITALLLAGAACTLPGVAAVVVNTSQPERVRENVRAAIERLPDAFWESFGEEGLLPGRSVID